MVCVSVFNIKDGYIGERFLNQLQYIFDLNNVKLTFVVVKRNSPNISKLISTDISRELQNRIQ